MLETFQKLFNGGPQEISNLLTEVLLSILSANCQSVLHSTHVEWYITHNLWDLFFWLSRDQMRFRFCLFVLWNQSNQYSFAQLKLAHRYAIFLFWMLKYSILWRPSLCGDRLLRPSLRPGLMSRKEARQILLSGFFLLRLTKKISQKEANRIRGYLQ